MDELQKQVKELQTEVDRLKKLAENEGKVYLSQLTVEFERAICIHVLPEVFSNNRNTSNANIIALVNMLNGDPGYIRLRLNCKESDITAILSGAKRRWEKLCDDLKFPQQWKTITGKDIDYTHDSVPDIFRAMKLLRDKRNRVAHPIPVKLQDAQKMVETSGIEKELDDEELELVKYFISSGLQEI